MNSLIDIVDIATLVALLINTIALIVIIYQTHIARQSLATTKKSIDEAKTQRQLEALPKLTWVIEVQVQLEHWEKDLKEKEGCCKKG